MEVERSSQCQGNHINANGAKRHLGISVDIVHIPDAVLVPVRMVPAALAHSNVKMDGGHTTNSDHKHATAHIISCCSRDTDSDNVDCSDDMGPQPMTPMLIASALTLSIDASIPMDVSQRLSDLFWSRVVDLGDDCNDDMRIARLVQLLKFYYEDTDVIGHSAIRDVLMAVQSDPELKTLDATAHTNVDVLAERVIRACDLTIWRQGITFKRKTKDKQAKYMHLIWMSGGPSVQDADATVGSVPVYPLMFAYNVNAAYVVVPCWMHQIGGKWIIDVADKRPVNPKRVAGDSSAIRRSISLGKFQLPPYSPVHALHSTKVANRQGRTGEDCTPMRHVQRNLEAQLWSNRQMYRGIRTALKDHVRHLVNQKAWDKKTLQQHTDATRKAGTPMCLDTNDLNYRRISDYTDPRVVAWLSRMK